VHDNAALSYRRIARAIVLSLDMQYNKCSALKEVIKMSDERADLRNEYIAGYQRYCAESSKMKKASIKFHRVKSPSVKEYIEFEIVKKKYREICQQWQGIQQRCFVPLENVSLEEFISSKEVITKFKKEQEKDWLLDPNNQSDVAKAARQFLLEKDTIHDRSNDPDYEYDEEQDLYVKKSEKHEEKS
jgi:hypothetical protein